MFVLILASLGAISLIAPAAAQTAVPARDVGWSWDPLVLTGVILAALWYAAGAMRLLRRFGRARLVALRQVIFFGAGLLTIIIALVSPIDSIADQLFWVHMVEHLLLLLVAAPLLVAGRPAIVCLWAFGIAGRKRLGRAWQALGLRAGFKGLMHPLLVWALFCGGFVFWHFPGPYQWTLRNETVHTFEHLTFLVTALMFWSIVIEPSGRRRLGYGSTIVFVATAAILSALPGALIALAPRPLYPAYGSGPAAWGLTLLQDQQLAGFVMWIPGGVVYIGAIIFLLLKWLEEGDGRRLVITRQVVASLLIFACPPLLGGCGKNNPSGRTDPPAGNAMQREVQLGARLIQHYGCGACHTIPGIDDADGVVGPPLSEMGRRIYIAGLLRNTPDNMVAWLTDPQRVVPGVVMPDMGLNTNEARAVAAYLSTLR